jgi:hypothetical protein
MNDGRVNASRIHLLQQIILRETGHLAVRRIGREALAPDVDLCVDNRHDVLLLCLLSAYADRTVGRLTYLPGLQVGTWARKKPVICTDLGFECVGSCAEQYAAYRWRTQALLTVRPRPCFSARWHGV